MPFPIYQPFILPSPDLELLSTLPSVSLLSDAININDTEVNSFFAYFANDATDSSWPGTSSLFHSAIGIELDQGSPLLGTNDTSVLYDGTATFRSISTSFANITTEDIVLECVFRATGDTCVLFGKRDGGVGWEVGIDASDRLYLTIEDAGGSSTVVSAALDYCAWYYALIFADRSGNAQIYLNGVASGSAVDISGETATLANTEYFESGISFTGNLSYMAGWKQADWLDSATQTTFAFQRAMTLFATYVNTVPSEYTRDSSAYLPKKEGGYLRYYLVGSGWPRFASINDDEDTNIQGYYVERTITNQLVYTEDFSQADWTKTRISLDASSETPPDKYKTATDIIASSDDDTHLLTQTTGPFVGTKSASIFVKAGDVDWFYISCDTDSRSAYFDLSTGTVGTVTADATASIESFGAGWYRCILHDEVPVPPIPRAFSFGPANADGDNDFAGDGSTVSCTVFGPQVEAGTLHTTYIPTAAAAADRAADVLEYPVSDLGSIGTVVLDVLRKDLQTASYPFFLSDGGDSADAIYLKYDTSTCNGKVRASGENEGSITGTTSSIDRVIHTYRLIYAPNDMSLYVDGDLEGTDTDCGVPDDLDQLEVGTWSSNQISGVIRNLYLYKSKQSP